MPHVVVEYTDDLSKVLDVDLLIAALHDAALASGHFPAGGCRTLARPIDRFLFGDRSMDNIFVYVNVRILPGRSEETKKAVLECFARVAEETLRPVLERRPIGLQVEISEFDADLTVQRNSMLPITFKGAYQRRALHET